MQQYCVREVQNPAHPDAYRLDSKCYILIWCCSCNDWVSQPCKLFSETFSIVYLILKIRLNDSWEVIISVRTTVVDFLPVTLSLALLIVGQW